MSFIDKQYKSLVHNERGMHGSLHKPKVVTRRRYEDLSPGRKHKVGDKVQIAKTGSEGCEHWSLWVSKRDKCYLGEITLRYYTLNESEWWGRTWKNRHARVKILEGELKGKEVSVRL